MIHTVSNSPTPPILSGDKLPNSPILTENKTPLTPPAETPLETPPETPLKKTAEIEIISNSIPFTSFLFLGGELGSYERGTIREEKKRDHKTCMCKGAGKNSQNSQTPLAAVHGIAQMREGKQTSITPLSLHSSDRSDSDAILTHMVYDPMILTYSDFLDTEKGRGVNPLEVGL